MTDKQQTINGYPVVRSDRRTISINVDQNGNVTIRAPKTTPVTELRRFVEEKQEWIQRAVQRQAIRQEQAPAFAVGESIPYLGGSLQVTTCEIASASARGNTLLLPQYGDPREHALRWLFGQAQTYLPQRVLYWSQIMQITPASITIANPRTRWGSMKSDGSLRLNVALMHCAPELIDYVIVHELSHRVHMNHSPAFHAHTERYLPDAKQRRAALKQCGAYLQLLRPAGE